MTQTTESWAIIKGSKILGCGLTEAAAWNASVVPYQETLETDKQYFKRMKKKGIIPVKAIIIW